MPLHDSLRMPMRLRSNVIARSKTRADSILHEPRRNCRRVPKRPPTTSGRRAWRSPDCRFSTGRRSGPRRSGCDRRSVDGILPCRPASWIEFSSSRKRSGRRPRWNRRRLKTPKSLKWISHPCRSKSNRSCLCPSRHRRTRIACAAASAHCTARSCGRPDSRNCTHPCADPRTGRAAAHPEDVAAESSPFDVPDAVRFEILSGMESDGPLHELQRPRPQGLRVWLTAAGLFALLLAAQVIHHNREYLTSHGPLAGLLRAVYARAGAPVSSAANLSAYQLRQWGVSGDPAADGTLRVRASILNRCRTVGALSAAARHVGESLRHRHRRARFRAERVSRQTHRALFESRRAGRCHDGHIGSGQERGRFRDRCVFARRGSKNLMCQRRHAGAD